MASRGHHNSLQAAAVSQATKSSERRSAAAPATGVVDGDGDAGLLHGDIAVIGLGYVGLPLALALVRTHSARVVGFDIDSRRVEALRAAYDRTGETAASELRLAQDDGRLIVTTDTTPLNGVDIMIVTVPTPVDDANQPDLAPLQAACEAIGAALSRRAPGARRPIVVFESTVYPGVTEDICGPWIEEASGLCAGRDFFLGYSPERINPGDITHTIDRTVKVVAGQNRAVATALAELYGKVTGAGVFVARDIRTAEAAKVIENAQRDINIAFINEVTQIFQKIGISVFDVLDAARTKWNFLDFRPGLVGGHCIGVDPFYLSHLAEKLGHHPEVILAGRHINDRMGTYIAECIARELGEGRKDVLVLGLTFKENVPDLRNSKVADVIAELRGLGHRVTVHDPLADAREAAALYKIEVLPRLPQGQRFDCVIGAVAHKAYRDFTADDLAAMTVPGGLVADIKGMWRGLALPAGVRRWEL